jgi:hypothetical protein
VPAFARWPAALCRPAPLATLAQRLNISPGPLSRADQSSVADETSTKRSCAFEGGLIEAIRATAIFWRVKQKGPRAPKSWFSPLFLPDSSSASRFTAGAFEIFILSQSGGAPGTLGGILH